MTRLPEFIQTPRDLATAQAEHAVLREFAIARRARRQARNRSIVRIAFATSLGLAFFVAGFANGYNTGRMAQPTVEVARD